MMLRVTTSLAASGTLPRRRCCFGPAPVCCMRRVPLRTLAFRDEPVERKVQQQVSRATVKVGRKVSGLLSSPDTQARSYWALGCATLGAAALALLAPARLAGELFGTPTGGDPVVSSFVRCAGATLLTTATVKFTLKEAALRGQLHMATFQRLQLGLVLQSAAGLVLLAQAISLRTPLLCGVMAPLCASTLLLAWRVYALHRAEPGLPLPSLARTLSGGIGLLMPATPAAAAYSLLTLVLACMAGVCLSASPGGSLRLYQGVCGPMTVFAQRAAGGGLMLMAVVAYCCKDGADRGKLGATTFRWLNLGLAGSLLAMLTYLTADWSSGLVLHSAHTAGMLATEVLAFAWTSALYILGTSKPKAHGGQQQPSAA